MFLNRRNGTQPPSAAYKALRRRLRQLGLLTAGVFAALTLAIATGTSSQASAPDAAHATRTARAITSLLAGIPQNANMLGQLTAPITLDWYGDLECPYCKEFTLGALPSIIRRWVRSGELKIEYLSMETATREPAVFHTQQAAALAAGLQNKLWNYIETFYHEQGEEDSGYVTPSYLTGLARQVPGLNVNLWEEDRFDPELTTQVERERQTAIHDRFRGTPTFLIGLSQGPLYQLNAHPLTSPRSFDEAIEKLAQS